MRQTHWARPRRTGATDPPRNYLYFGALVLIALALLTYIFQAERASEITLAAGRIEAAEQRGRDAHPPSGPARDAGLCQRLPRAAGRPLGCPPPPATTTSRTRLDALTEDGIARLWVLPDATPPEASPWEEALRRDHYLLAESRPAGPDGRRLALYALAGAFELGETGLGTIFGDPALGAQPVTAENGWFRLAGYSLTQETAPGGEILLALRWESLRPVEYDYQVFVHLLDKRGERIAQRDGQPVQWMRPTSTWQPGEEIIDRYGMTLPDDLPPGRYTIVVGLYDPVTGQRLPVSAGPGDFAIELGPVLVETAR